MRPSGLLLLLYVAFVLPLISIGFSLSPLENFQIPNFISSVILASPLLKTLYFLLLACLAFLTLRYLFTFHVMLLEEKSVREAVIVLAALYGTWRFEEIFRPERQIRLLAHRAGDDLGAENSLEGLAAAIELGADCSEIDIQRTRDGHYVLNHDGNFQRVAGVKKSSSEMTLAEIRELRIQDAFDSSRPATPVPTLEEILDLTRGRISLFIELKGATADPQMVDDVVSMVRERQMEEEVALLSLDYALIEYIEEEYPEMTSVYLYFFAIGDIPSLKGDILIMEEAEATPRKIRAIRQKIFGY